MAITSTTTLAAAIKQVCPLIIPAATLSAGYLGNVTNAGSGPTGTFAIPTAYGSGGNIPTNNTAGAIYSFANARSGNRQYLGAIELATPGQTSLTLLLMDRVWACSGFDGQVTTTQTVVGMPALTRPGATGVGLVMMLENYATSGSTPQTVTVTYTNSAGVAGRTTVPVTMSTSKLKGTLTPLPLQAGDQGVQSIQSLIFGGATASAANLGLSLYLPLAVVGAGGSSEFRNMETIEMGMPRILDNACLCLMSMATTTICHGTMELIQG